VTFSDMPESAFPFTFEHSDGSTLSCPGMTLRDYFAGQALAGIATTLSPQEITELAVGIKGGKFVVGASYALADAMLETRKK